MDTGADGSALGIIKHVDDAPLSNKELNALDRGTELINKVDIDLTRVRSTTSTSQVLSPFEPGYKKIFRNVLQWVVANPVATAIVGIGGVSVVAIWYTLQNWLRVILS